MLVCGICAVPAAHPQSWTGGFGVYVWLVPACTTGAGRCPASWERGHAANPGRRKSTQPDCPRNSDRVLGRLVGDHSVQDTVLSSRCASDRDIPRRISTQPKIFGRASHLSVASREPARRRLSGRLCRDHSPVPSHGTGGRESRRCLFSSILKELGGGYSRLVSRADLE